MPELAQSETEIRFEVPEIMDWTILPASVTASAWTDPEVRALLLSDATTLLRERVSRWPSDKTFCVAVDSAEVKFFPLPARKSRTAAYSREALREILTRETGDDDSLEHWLPSDVIADALSDDEFKRELIGNPGEVLRSRGYSPPARQIVVLENSESTYHLVLPENPSRQEDLDHSALEATLVAKFGVETTKCCASGTCD
jgi:hypothetical protein